MKFLQILLVCLLCVHASDINSTQNFTHFKPVKISAQSVLADKNISLNVAEISAQSTQTSLQAPLDSFTLLNDENASDEQIDGALDALLAFARANPEHINDEFGEFSERIMTSFILNNKILKSGKFDFARIEAVLALKPDLDYDIGTIFSPLGIANSYGCDVGLRASGDENATQPSASDVFALIDLLVRSGATPDSGILAQAVSCDNFDAFAYLLANGAEVGDGVVSGILGSELLYLNERNIRVLGAEVADLRRMAQKYDFAKFQGDKLRFIEETLKYKGINELNQKELEGFIKFTAMMDDTLATQLLLEHGICEKQSQMCAYMKSQANYYGAQKISDLLSLELSHRF